MVFVAESAILLVFFIILCFFRLKNVFNTLYVDSANCKRNQQTVSIFRKTKAESVSVCRVHLYLQFSLAIAESEKNNLK